MLYFIIRKYKSNYSESFGYQWNKFDITQLDSKNKSRVVYELHGSRKRRDSFAKWKWEISIYYSESLLKDLGR